MKANYHPPSIENWIGRASGNADYLHENIRLLNLSETVNAISSEAQAAILGYACDTGVLRNLGRPGASEGPMALRSALGKLPFPDNGLRQLWDAGDVECILNDLESAQNRFSSAIENLLTRGLLPIAIGGGHDIAYAHYMGIRNYLKGSKSLGIINFDAHLDLRQPNPVGHSGSPFFQIADDCRRQQTPFRYACIGLREDANPRELWQRANALGVLQVMRSKLLPKYHETALDKLASFVDGVDVVYLTMDMDGFSSAIAPGVSAASPMGFYPEDIMPFLDLILQSKKLISVDLAELNPKYDQDNQTALLAAALIHKILREVF